MGLRKPRWQQAAPARTPCHPCLELAVMRGIGRVLLRRVVRRVGLVCSGHAHLPRHKLLLGRHHGGLLAGRARPQAHLREQG